MTVIYPSLESAEFEAGFRAVVAAIEDLAHLFDRYGIGQQPPGPLDAATVEAFEAVLARLSAVQADRQTLVLKPAGAASAGQPDMVIGSTPFIHS